MRIHLLRLGTIGAAVLAAACSADDNSSGTIRMRDPGGSLAPGGTSTVENPGLTGNGNGLPPLGNDGLGSAPPAATEGRILAGPPFGCPTSLSGTVFDPAGQLPLYNVVVYVPSEPLSAISEGASCATCNGDFSGKPVAVALSDAAGKFTLTLDTVPRTESLPLVVQVGKWRRLIEVPGITQCTSNSVQDGSVRLPRNRSEGNLPHIAVVRGGSDALECLFRKIGVSDSEFSTDASDGRIHLYASTEGTATSGTSQLGSAPIPLPGTLYADLAKLKTYDAVFMACEGDGRGPFEKYTAAQFANVQAYADQGGRVFGSHYHNYWVRTDKFEEQGVGPYPEVAEFASSQHGFDVDVVGDVDTSFPKGQALGEWLLNVGASTTAGKLPIKGGEHTVDAALPGISQRWIGLTDPDGHQVVQYFSFNAPVGQTECGRMVFSDLHVATGTGDSGKVAFPMGCTSTALSPQEKALAFMLFDLSSCVQPDTAPVYVPMIR